MRFAALLRNPFLRITNGLDFNGTLFFAAENEPDVDNPSNMIEWPCRGQPQSARERRGSVPNIWESGMEMHALNPKVDRYEAVDTVSLDAYESFATFDELFGTALTKRLG